jgi:hypothetical protein
MIRRLLLALALGLPAAAGAESSYDHGRVRYVEQGVALQRETETGAEEALTNTPFLPGDRVWTSEGRLELQFAGTLVRLDRRGKLDYVAHDRDRVVLRLWSGALYVHQRKGDEAVVVETPDAAVESDRSSAYRVDVRGGETRVWVLDGQAEVAGDRRTTVREGEWLAATDGRVEEDARRFDRDEADEFARWDEERQGDARWADRHEYLPDDVAPYAGELDRYGDWYYEGEVGHVWRPFVSQGWQPYTNGRWAWTSYGWTWVPFDPWGWAPYHYGRWGWAGHLGWYWIPGRTWGPAWVSWAVDDGNVGWCPLGYGDRPVVVGAYRGRAVTRGRAAQPWVVAPRADLGAPDLARRARTGVGISETARLVSPSEGTIGRDLRIIEGGRPVLREGERATPRGVRTRPAPGATLPVLRSDPQTTISPVPAPRRRQGSDEERERARVVRPQTPSEAPAAVPAADTPARSLPTESRPVRVAPRPSGERRPSVSEREAMEPLFRAIGRRPTGGERSRGEASSPRAAPAAPRVSAPAAAAPRVSAPAAAAPRPTAAAPRPSAAAPRPAASAPAGEARRAAPRPPKEREKERP